MTSKSKTKGRLIFSVLKVWENKVPLLFNLEVIWVTNGTFVYDIFFVFSLRVHKSQNDHNSVNWPENEK